MKVLAVALVAGVPLWACTVDEASSNQAGAGAANAMEVAADEGQPSADPRQGSDGAGDVPVAGERSTPAGPTSPEEADQCGASRYQWLVGRQRSAIPPEPEGARWRIACTGCPITMDYSPARLNIFFDQETERIEEVRCG